MFTAAAMSGKPTYKYVIDPDLDDEGRVKLVPETDDWGKSIIDKRTGKPVLRQKMIRRKVKVWTGAEGALGYLKYLAQENEALFAPMVKMIMDQQKDHKGVEGLQLPTLEELREEWIRRGLRAVDFDKMKVVKGIQAKQRVKLIEHDPNERMRVRNGSSKQDRDAASTTEPEDEQWWPDEPKAEEDEAEAED